MGTHGSRSMSFSFTFAVLSFLALAKIGARAISCNEYMSPDSGESVADPLWGNSAAAKAVSGTNSTYPFFLCYTALATYTYADNSKKGFALFGGVANENSVFNGVGGEPSVLEPNFRAATSDAMLSCIPALL